MKKLVTICLAVIFVMAGVSYAAPMGTAFTYQGRLVDANSPAEGLYDFEFKLYDHQGGSNQFGNTVTKDEVDVIDGYFTVQLDFVNDANVFDGDARWLEIAVRPWEIEGDNSFVALSPRQQVTSTPYVLYSNRSGSADYTHEAGNSVTVGGYHPWDLIKVSPISPWPVEGNYIPKFEDDPNYLENSIIYQEGESNIGIGTTDPSEALDVEGNIAVSGSVDGVDVANHTHSVIFNENFVHDFAVIVGVRYVGPGINTGQATDRHFMICTASGTVTKMYVYAKTAPGSTRTLDLTVRKNGGNTSMSVLLSDSSTSGSDTANGFAVAAGDRISVEFNASTGCAASDISVTLEIAYTSGTP
jgi:hypothetical protein